MSTFILTVAFILVAYLLGSIPFGLLISQRLKGVDIRTLGSGNIGATNVFRTVGKKWGIVVFLLDTLKGYLAVVLPRSFPLILPIPVQLCLGIAAIVGHSFPVWLRFHGGKGVATSLGVFLAIAPLPTSLAFLCWTVVFIFNRIISLASLSAALAFPCLVYVTERHRDGFLGLFGVSLGLCLFIFFTHRENLRRLFKGEEKRII